MKILLVTSVFKDAAVGPARFAKLLVDRQNLDIHVLTEGVKETDTIHVVTYQLPFWQRKFRRYFAIKYYQYKLKEIETNFDVIIFNHSSLAYKFQTDKPSFVMVNDAKLLEIEFTTPFDYLRRKVLGNIERKVLKSGTQIITNSIALKEKITRSVGVSESSINVLYKGINLDLYNVKHPAQISAEQPIKVLFVKNDFKIGGLKYLIEALGLLPQYQFELYIVGPDINHLPIIDLQNVRPLKLGKVDNNEVASLIYQSHILAIPSLYEPLGVAIMEGLAAGIPTITTNVGGLPEVTENGNLVWTCLPKDSKSISLAIQDCINDAYTRIQKSNEGRIHVRKHFDFQQVEQRLKEILKI